MKEERIAMWIMLVVVAVLSIGYILNVVKLCQCDFKSPYKAEVIRSIGVITGIGSFIGYFSIDDTIQKENN